MTNNELYNKATKILKDVELFHIENLEELPKLPGLGGAGLGLTYTRNINELRKYYIKSNLIKDDFEPDLKAKFLDISFPMPILPSPMSGIETNLSGLISEYDFIDNLFKGCKNYGTLGLCGDSNDSTNNYIVPELIRKYGGIAICKPRKNEIILEKIKKLEESGVSAIGIDLDGLGGVKLFQNKSVYLKSKDDLKIIRDAIKVPAFLKGITSLEDAKIAYELGYDGIIISNHGGRSVDYLPSTLECLIEISKELKGKLSIGVDGGVFSGYDAFIYLANGADMVFAGRAFLNAIIAEKSDGVESMLNQFYSELKKTMMFTNCKNIGEICDEKIIRREY